MQPFFLQASSVLALRGSLKGPRSACAHTPDKHMHAHVRPWFRVLRAISLLTRMLSQCALKAHFWNLPGGQPQVCPCGRALPNLPLLW